MSSASRIPSSLPTGQGRVRVAGGAAPCCRFFLKYVGRALPRFPAQIAASLRAGVTFAQMLEGDWNGAAAQGKQISFTVTLRPGAVSTTGASVQVSRELLFPRLVHVWQHV